MPGAERIPERITWGVDQLHVRATDRILEIGCGGGHALALLCERVTRGSIVAIDRSALQVKQARARNRACIGRGHARVVLSSLGEAPDVLPGERFNRIFAINVNAFWTAPAVSLESVKRLLAPRGGLYLIYEPPSEGQLQKIRRSLESALAVKEIRVTTFRKGHGLCVVA